jgi:hypothetical protein
VIDVYDAIGSLVERRNWTDRNAGCVRALVAPEYGEGTLDLREMTLFGVLHPCPKIAQGDVILRFTGNSAGMAANAPRHIENETELQKRAP